MHVFLIGQLVHNGVARQEIRWMEWNGVLNSLCAPHQRDRHELDYVRCSEWTLARSLPSSELPHDHHDLQRLNEDEVAIQGCDTVMVVVVVVCMSQTA